MLAELYKSIVLPGIVVIGSNAGTAGGSDPEIVPVAARLRQLFNPFYLLIAVGSKQLPYPIYDFLHKFSKITEIHGNPNHEYRPRRNTGGIYCLYLIKLT